MTDIEELSAAIEALQSKPVGNGRQLAAKDPQVLLSALLAECEMTILPRQLKFIDDDGGVLGVTVSNRRVFNVERLGGGETLAASEELEYEDAEQMASLYSMLDAFLANRQTITVASGEPPQSLGSGRVGVPVAKLAALWDLKTARVFQAKDHGGVEIFAEMIQPDVQCCVILENEHVVLSFGEAEQTKSLIAYAKENFASFSRLLEDSYPMRDATKRLVVLSVSPENEEGLICATAHSSTLLALIAPNAIPDVLEKWQNF